jgi:hypothetical protein
MKLRTPDILGDLYRDLRDRRLLIPIVALAIALVAVPVLLSSSGSSDVAPASTAAALPEDATAVEPAVLAEQNGIRNYRKRLAALKAKNPFEQKFALPTPSSVELEPDSEAASSAASASSISSTVTPDTSAIADAAQSVTETATEPTTSAPTSAAIDGDGSSSQPVEESKPSARFFAGRVDVKLGTYGDTKDYKDVRRLDFLPNDKHPLVVFVGLTEDGSRAIFSLSSEITETAGEGSCAPKQPSPCQFLRLKTGEERELTVGAEGTAYRLKLLKTHIVRVPDPRDD